MIGTVFGVALAISFLSAAFSSSTDTDNLFSNSLFAGLGTIAILTIIGVFLFPRTIGIAFTPPLFVSPIAIIGGGVKHGFTYGVTMAIFAIALWAASQLIALVRPSAT